MKPHEMIVAGVMSGTSADGIDVALVRIGQGSSSPASRAGTGRRGRGRSRHALTLLGHAHFPYPARVRAAVLQAMNAGSASVADLARLNFVLGQLYADAILKTQRKFRVSAELVGCHGQTLYHQGQARSYLGRRVFATWQTGEAALIAARVGVPAVSEFRPADMAAGGKGAPLVPFLDYLLFRDSKLGRVVQNIGGIANLTAIPAGAGPEHVLAFDTGPGNMVIDALSEEFFNQPFDKDGKLAATGQVLESVLARMMRRSFFRAAPPKTAGREEFGWEFVREFRRRCGRAPAVDVLATATALTARSIADAVRRFVLPSIPAGNFQEMIISGGGTKNATLTRMLRESLAPLGIDLRFSDELGLPSQAKEAVAFAVLAYETWNRRPSNIPSATGAKRPAVLGKISYA
jgi:anhydro-N-acetylmuramic acid kinase